MATNDGPRLTPRLIIGLAILVLGMLWTLDNLNILDADVFTRWWPAVLIALGAVQFSNRGSNHAGPVLLIVIGAVLLGRNLRWIHFGLGDLIPLAIAAWGAKLVWDALARRSARAGADDGDASVHAFAMMGGVHWHTTSREFRGGDVNAIMGGVEVDLRDAQMKPGEEVILDVLALMGGIEIWVPPGWRVVGNVLPIMGAFEDKSAASNDAGPTLTVRGTAVMGGVEVKN
jgi:predicted membrane protein